MEKGRGRESIAVDIGPYGKPLPQSTPDPLRVARQTAPNEDGVWLSLSLCGRRCSGTGDGLTHVGVGLDVAELVVVENAELAAAEGVGHGFGHFGFRVDEHSPAFLDAGVLFLLSRDRLSA